MIFYVALSNPKGDSQYGGVIAAPLFRKAAEFLIPYLAIPPTGVEPPLQSALVQVSIPAPATIGELLPDLTGASKRDLLPLLDRGDLNLVLEGSGYVVRQTPPPGTPVAAGMTVALALE